MDVVGRQLRIRCEIPPELLREVETRDVRQAAEKLLQERALAELLGVDRSASTVAASGDQETLTIDKLAAAVDRVVPALYYKTSEAIPKVDDDGGEFIVGIQLGSEKVWFFHPDWLPRIKAELGSVRRLVEFDMQKYAMEEAHMALQRAGFVRYGKHWVME